MKSRTHFSIDVQHKELYGGVRRLQRLSGISAVLSASAEGVFLLNSSEDRERCVYRAIDELTVTDFHACESSRVLSVLCSNGTVDFVDISSLSTLTTVSAAGADDDDPRDNVKATWTIKVDRGVQYAHVASACYAGGHTLIAVLGSNNDILVYNLALKYVVRMIKHHQPLHHAATVMLFHPKYPHLIVSQAGGVVARYDVGDSPAKLKPMKAHLNTVNEITVTEDGSLISTSVDAVINAWTYSGKRAGIAITIPAFENIFSCQLLQYSARLWAMLSEDAPKPLGRNDSLLVTGGEQGGLRLWHLEGKRELRRLWTSPTDVVVSICVFEDMLCCGTDADDVVWLNPLTGAEQKRLVGPLEEVVDCCAISADVIGVACSGPSSKLWNFKLNRWATLEGHSDTVLSMHMWGDARLATGAKDTTVRVWDVSEPMKPIVLDVLNGHTEAVNMVRWHPKDQNMLASVSRDRTIKVWSATTKTALTAIAHKKEALCCAWSPDGKWLATGGGDKEVALWEISSDLIIRQRMTGHSRGIWDVQFSPSLRVVASASADKTIRIWNCSSGTCARVLQGHLAGVVRVNWFSGGLQCVSSGGDGLIKVWTVADGSHVDVDSEIHSGARIWALSAVSGGNYLLSGDSEGTLAIWRDDTQEVLQSELDSKQQRVAGAAEVEALGRGGQLGEALLLSLRLKRDRDAFKWSKVCPDDLLKTFVIPRLLEQGNIELLLSMCSLCTEWNKTNKTCVVAQRVMNCLLTTVPYDELVRLGADNSQLVSCLTPWTPYSQRHLERINGLLQGCGVLQLAVDAMK